MKQSTETVTKQQVQETSHIDKIVQSLKEACEKKQYEFQVKAYQALGEEYLAKKADSINAIALYNFAVAICQDEQKNTAFIQTADFYQVQLVQKIKEAEKQFLFSVMGKSISPSDYKLDQAHKEYLKAIRDEARATLMQHDALVEILEQKLPTYLERLEKITHVQQALEKHQLSIQQIYKTISEQLRSFVSLLIEECKQTLSRWRQPPDEKDYAIVCFGSLARDEATPYSDLEFGILLAERADTEENKEYLRALTRLLNIKIINLGETTPRMQNIKELEEVGLLERYSESPTRHGFCFDGNNKDGRKTPLGNKYFNDISEYEKYELIGTPKQIALLHSAVWYEKDQHLSTALGTAVLITGSGTENELLQEYRNIIHEFLYHTTTTWTFSSNQIELPLAETRALVLLFKDAEYFGTRMGNYQESRHLFSAKYDFFRLPNMVLDHLALYFGSEDVSLWERVNRLKDIITAEGATNLKAAASKITKIRLNAYLRQDCQHNHIILLSEKQPEQNIKMLNHYFQIRQEELLEIYCTLIPLYSVAKQFAKHNDKSLLRSTFYSDNDEIRLEIFRRLLDYPQAIYHGERAIKLTEDSFDKALLLVDLGLIHFESGNMQQAEKLLRRALPNLLSHRGEYDINLARVLVNLSHIYDALGYVRMKKDLLERARPIFELYYDKNHPEMAKFLFNLSTVYNDLGEGEKKKKLLKQALVIQEKYYGRDDPQVARILTNLGNAYKALNKSNRQKELQERALAIQEKHFGKDHPEVALPLYNLSIAYIKLGNMQKAKELLEQALAIQEKHFGKDHPEVATTLVGLGNVYGHLGNFKKKKELLELAITIREDCYGPLHPKVANILFNLGEDCMQRREDLEAANYLRRAHFIFVSDPNHGETHPITEIIAVNLKKLLISDQTSELIKPSLGDNKKVLDIWINENQQRLVLASIYLKENNLLDATNAYKQALAMVGNGVPLEDVQLIYHNLAHCYNAQGNIKKAERHFSLALALQPTNETYFNYGLFLMEQGRFTEAIEIFNRILVPWYAENGLISQASLVKVENKLSLNNVEAVCHNIADCYHAQGDITKAEAYFLLALKLQSTADTCSAYGLLLLRQNRYQEAYEILNQATVCASNDSKLIYGLSQKHLFDIYLQQEITTEKSLKIEPIYLAYYWLIQCCQQLSQIEKMGEYLVTLAKEVKIEKLPLHYRLLSYAYQFLDNKGMAEKYKLKGQEREQSITVREVMTFPILQSFDSFIQRTLRDDQEEIEEESIKSVSIELSEKQDSLLKRPDAKQGKADFDLEATSKLSLIKLVDEALDQKTDVTCFSGLSNREKEVKTPISFRDSPITTASDAHNELLRRLEKMAGDNQKDFQSFFNALHERAYAKALCMACTTGSGEEILKMISILLEYKAVLSININEQAGDKQWAAIHYAAQKGNQALYDLLVQQGADEDLLYDNITVREYLRQRQNQLRNSLS